jgi:hypothetical protein
MKILLMMMAIVKLSQGISDLSHLTVEYRKNIVMIINQDQLKNFVETSTFTECPNLVLFSFDAAGKQLSSMACSKQEFRATFMKEISLESFAGTFCVLTRNKFYVLKLHKKKNQSIAFN